MLIEEKRRKCTLNYSQMKVFSLVDEAVKHDPNYYGFWLMQFENTSPNDGDTWITRLNCRHPQGWHCTDEDGVLRFLEFAREFHGE